MSRLDTLKLQWLRFSASGYKRKVTASFCHHWIQGLGAIFLTSSTVDSTAGTTAAVKAQRKAQAGKDRGTNTIPRNTEGCDSEFPVHHFPQSMPPGPGDFFFTFLSCSSNTLGELILLTTWTPTVYQALCQAPA